MTNVPSSPLRIFRDFAFETSFSLAILLIAAASLMTGANPSGRLEGALDVVLYAVWQWGLLVFAASILAALALRPWAARRAPLTRAETTLANLRTYEAVACVGLATSCLVYAVTVIADGLDNAMFVAGAMVSFSWGFFIRSRDLQRANRDRLEELRRVREASD